MVISQIFRSNVFGFVVTYARNENSSTPSIEATPNYGVTTNPASRNKKVFATGNQGQM